MKLKARVVAVALAATMAVSLLQYPAVNVRAEEIAQEAEDATVEGITTDMTKNEITSDETQDQEKVESQNPTDKGDADTDDAKDKNETKVDENVPKDDESTSDDEVNDENNNSTENGDNDTKPDEREGEKGEDDENAKPEGGTGEITNKSGTEDSKDASDETKDELLPGAEQNPDTIQNDLEADSEPDKVKKELANNAEIALISERTYSGDDYPGEYRDLAGDAVVDRWNFYNRECTSFVAWCLNSRNGINFTNQYLGVSSWGHAKDWGGVAQSLGIAVDMNPAIGAVAWSSSGTYGHVAWVSSVDGDAVTVEEYNYNTPYGFGERSNIPKTFFEGYIHIADIPETPITPEAHWTLNANGVLTIYDDEGMPGWTENVYDEFDGQKDAKSIILTSNVTAIKSSAFVDFSNLTSITIPNSVTAIGALAFQGCNNLASITIPTSVTSIEKLTFSHCNSLTNVTIPGSITSIGDNAFAYCNNMNSIFIPNTVASIGYGAFYKCDKLTDVYYGGSKSEWEAIQINQGMNECLTNATIHYEKLSLNIVQEVLKKLVFMGYNKSKVGYIGIFCPVDVKIYSADGQLVGDITDNVAGNVSSDKVYIDIIDGEKHILLLEDNTYILRLNGTGQGTMTYTIQNLDVGTGNAMVEQHFENVALSSGKKFTSEVVIKDNIAVDVETKEVKLYVIDENGNPEKEVLDDGNGTEILIKSEDDPSDNPGSKPSVNPGNKPGDPPSGDKPSDDSGNGDGDEESDSKAYTPTSSSRSSSSKAIVETWRPTTPDEKKRYACMGKEAVQYTLAKDNTYRIVIENAMQGPMCFKSFEAVLGDYTIGRTYNVYTLPDSVYSKDKEIQFTIKIPSDIYKKDREYKMICVTKGGLPIVYNDIDTNPETITVRTNKFYAYALIYK